MKQLYPDAQSINLSPKVDIALFQKIDKFGIRKKRRKKYFFKKNFFCDIESDIDIDIESNIELISLNSKSDSDSPKNLVFFTN